MIDCFLLNNKDFCKKKEIHHFPKLEINILGNPYGYYNSFKEKSLNSWINKKLNLQPIHSTFYYMDLIESF